MCLRVCVYGGGGRHDDAGVCSGADKIGFMATQALPLSYATVQFSENPPIYRFTKVLIWIIRTSYTETFYYYFYTFVILK